MERRTVTFFVRDRSGSNQIEWMDESFCLVVLLNSLTELWWANKTKTRLFVFQQIRNDCGVFPLSNWIRQWIITPYHERSHDSPLLVEMVHTSATFDQTAWWWCGTNLDQGRDNNNKMYLKKKRKLHTRVRSMALKWKALNTFLFAPLFSSSSSSFIFFFLCVVTLPYCYNQWIILAQTELH